MNISFWLTSTTRLMNYANWGKVPMGGAEISALNLGKELLDRGHRVNYFLQRCEPFDKENLHIRRHDQVFDEVLRYFVCYHGSLYGLRLLGRHRRCHPY